MKKNLFPQGQYISRRGAECGSSVYLIYWCIYIKGMTYRIAYSVLKARILTIKLRGLRELFCI